jgi:hypothetical protein
LAALYVNVTPFKVTLALVIGSPVLLSNTKTKAMLLKPDGNKPGGTDPVGKLSSSAAMKGGPEAEPPPPPPPPPQEVNIKVRERKSNAILYVL